MADIKLELNVNELSKELDLTVKDIKNDFMKAVGNLAAATHAKALEHAEEDLGSLKGRYKNNLDFQQAEEGIWIVTVKEPAMFIEEGYSAWSMYDKIATSTKAKTTKEGHKYLTIPFEHSKPSSELGGKAREIVQELKSFMKSKKINIKKLEFNPDGSPKLGLIQRFDVDTGKPASPKAKYGALQGVAIYQSMRNGQVKRDIMTFRRVSEKTKGDGRWEYQAKPGAKILDKVLEWAKQEWESNILPELIRKEY